MTHPHQPGELLGDLDGLKHDMFPHFVEAHETPDPQEFSKWAIQHRGSFALWLTQVEQGLTKLDFNPWLDGRVDEDVEATDG